MSGPVEQNTHTNKGIERQRETHVRRMLERVLLTWCSNFDMQFHSVVPVRHDSADGRDRVEFDGIPARPQARFRGVLSVLVAAAAGLDEQDLLEASWLGPFAPPSSRHANQSGSSSSRDGTRQSRARAQMRDSPGRRDSGTTHSPWSGNLDRVYQPYRLSTPLLDHRRRLPDKTF